MTSDSLKQPALERGQSSEPKPPVTDHELREFIRLGKKLLWDSTFRETIESRGICLTPARFYNEIPTVRELREGFENQEEAPYSFPFLSRERLIETIQKLAQFSAEFNPPLEDEGGYYWKNPAFSFADAMSYYCFVRHVRPQTVLEIGSGYSTMVAAEAAAKNGSTRVACIEPYPKDFLRDLGAEIFEHFVQKYPVDFFNDTLADGDILFIDSTHTVKASSDCCHIYLRVLPNIRRKITVHVHDVTLPRGIDQKKAIEKHIYWTEQYLLAAYMLDNPKTDFLFGSAYANLVAKPEVSELMGNKYPPGGGSFWFALNGRI